MIERKETLGQLAARQQIVTAPLAKAIAEFGTGREIKSYAKQTPFGTFLAGWDYIEQGGEQK